MNSFASPLNSVTIELADSIFYKKKDSSLFKNIDVSKGRVEIYSMHCRGDPNALVNAINSFSKANTIKFANSNFGYYDYGSEDIKFEGIEVKNVIFEDFYFNSADAIKKIFADSGLAESLDSISFYKNSRLNESDMKKMFEKYMKKNGLKIIFDKYLKILCPVPSLSSPPHEIIKISVDDKIWFKFRLFFFE